MTMYEGELDESTIELLRFYGGLNARQKQIFAKAISDTADGKVSFEDPAFCANLSTQLEEARS